MTALDQRRLDEEVAGARQAQGRLTVTLAVLDDDTARRRSRLPDWSVGHVLTHLARNADSQRRVLEAAGRLESVDRYPGGAGQRSAEIEEGASRPAAELVADVAASAAALDAAWSATSQEAWARPGTSLGRPEPVADLPFKRWREVEVHHADLGLAFGWDDWSAGYVGRELRNAAMAWRATHPMGQTGLPTAALALAPNERLAWLLGRLEVDGLPEVRPWW